jgi:hypothetical protein
VKVVKWEGLGIGGNDVGAAYSCANFPIKSVQVIGTFDSATCTLQGSNMKDDATFASLTYDGTNAAAFTSAGIRKLQENSYWLRPVITSKGADTDLDVYLLLVTEK